MKLFSGGVPCFVLVLCTAHVGVTTAFAGLGGPALRRIQLTTPASSSSRPFIGNNPRHASDTIERITVLRTSSDSIQHDESSNDDSSTTSRNRLDELTSAFPLFVLASAILGYAKPSTLTWVNQGNLISILLAAIMCGTGLTLRPKDFTRVREEWRFVPLGVAAQFSIMPLTAWSVGRLLLLNQPNIGPSLFLGLW